MSLTGFVDQSCFGRFWKALEGFGRHGKALGGFGRFSDALEGLETLLQPLSDFVRLCMLWKLLEALAVFGRYGRLWEGFWKL